MYLRSFAVTIALATGLLLILALAFIMCIPAYVVSLIALQPPRPREFGHSLHGGRP